MTPIEELPDPWLDKVSAAPQPLTDDGSEGYLVNLLGRELTRDGIPFVLEQPCGDSSIRADVVTQNAVIEFKKDLERSKLYQARGQAETYAALLGKSQVIVVGRAPVSGTEELQARRIAEDFKSGGCHVIFADPQGYWLEDIKTLISTPSSRDSRPSVTTPDSGKVLGRIDALAEEIQEVRSLVVESHNYLLDAVEQSARSIAQPVKSQPARSHAPMLQIGGDRITRNASICAAVVSVLNLFLIASLILQPQCSRLQNDLRWEVQNGSGDGIRRAAQRFLSCSK